MHVSRKERFTIRLLCLGLALSWVTAAQAGVAPQFLLTANSGGQFQIGTGLPLPIKGTENKGPGEGIFDGGKLSATAGITFWPQSNDRIQGGLHIQPDPAFKFPAGTAGISQTGATKQGGAVVLPAGVLKKDAPAAIQPIAVFNTNPAVFQVATADRFSWPKTAATLAAGGAPGATVLPGPAGGLISYSGGTKAFGGAARFAINPGPAMGTGRVPSQVNTTAGTTMVPIASVWINAFAGLPATVNTVLIVGASAPNGQAEPGGPGTVTATTNFGGLSTKAFGAVNIPGTTAFDVGPNGTIAASVPAGGPGPANKVIGSKGFPWTTGFITISQNAADPPELFFLSGTDKRIASTTATGPRAGLTGVGNLSLVSGALSDRALSGPNANRGWVSLRLTTPEPGALLAGGGALAMLALCHGLVRSRSRR